MKEADLGLQGMTGANCNSGQGGQRRINAESGKIQTEIQETLK